MAKVNIKEFFGEYVKVRKVISNINLDDEYDVHGELNQRCLKAFEGYLYSYQWCNSETECQIFENSVREIPLIKMRIQVERNGEVMDLKPSSIRSASSRLSNRMYGIFGDGCFGVMLGSPDVDAEREALQRLLSFCVSLTDEYVFQNHFSIGFRMLVEKHISQIGGVRVPDRIDFSKEMADALGFFMENDRDSLISRLDSLDVGCVAMVYAVLSRKECAMQRAELLSHPVASGVSSQAYEMKIKELEDKMKELRELANKKLAAAKSYVGKLETKVRELEGR